jgi:hypothetical protein
MPSNRPVYSNPSHSLTNSRQSSLKREEHQVKETSKSPLKKLSSRIEDVKEKIRDKWH